MKEITRIHLAALPYNIEVAAKKELEKYLKAIESSLAADSDAMREIESRISEILAEHGVVGERVITADDVASVKSQLGDPKEFMSDDVASELKRQTGAEKRAMRDTHRALLGGVCAGLGAYFKIDPVWVRLVFVVLVLVTSGAALIAYLIAWIVIPPAHTAAERLQMAGKPVTLENLQEESVAVAADKADSRIILTMVRIMAGVASVLVGLAALMAIMVAGWRVWGELDRILEHGYWVPTLAFAIGGVLLIVLCGIAAYSLFAAKLTTKTIIAGSIIIGLGLVCGVIGGGGFSLLADRDNGRLAMNERVGQIAVGEEFANITSLVVDAQQNVEVQYTVTSEKPRVELRYGTMMATVAPSVEITTTGSTADVVVKGRLCRSGLSDCTLPAVLTIFGPALSTLHIKNGNLSYTLNGAQPSLAVTLDQVTSVDLIGDKELGALAVTMQEGSSLNTASANVHGVTATLLTRTHATFGSLAEAVLTLPESCAVNQQASVVLENAQRLTINNKPYDMTQKDGDIRLPCAEVTIPTR